MATHTLVRVNSKQVVNSNHFHVDEGITFVNKNCTVNKLLFFHKTGLYTLNIKDFRKHLGQGVQEWTILKFVEDNL